MKNSNPNYEVVKVVHRPLLRAYTSDYEADDEGNIILDEQTFKSFPNFNEALDWFIKEVAITKPNYISTVSVDTSKKECRCVCEGRDWKTGVNYKYVVSIKEFQSFTSYIRKRKENK